MKMVVYCGYFDLFRGISLAHFQQSMAWIDLTLLISIDPWHNEKLCLIFDPLRDLGTFLWQLKREYGLPSPSNVPSVGPI
jgi:hypothetical protein